jgi:hypothetical protein
VALVVVALVVLLILSRAVTRLSGLRHDRAFEEERDSVWSRADEQDAGRADVAGDRGRLSGPVFAVWRDEAVEGTGVSVHQAEGKERLGQGGR